MSTKMENSEDRAAFDRCIDGRRDYDEWKARKAEKGDADSIHTSG